jgi:hypothetical protein
MHQISMNRHCEGPHERMQFARSATERRPMAKLITKSQFPDPDAAYVALAQARRGLSEAAAAALDARLALILANHIGDLDVLNEAITLARSASGSHVRSS